MADSTLKVTGSYKNLDAIARFVTEWALKAALDERAIYAVQMAVDEACSNIIAHGYGGEGKGDIQVACQLLPDGLQVSITDFGASFAAENTAAAPESRAEGALGLFLMRQLMDKVRFETAGGQNKLIMEKRNG